MARRSIDIRQFSGELRSHFAALLSDRHLGRALAQDAADGNATSAVMAAFDYALTKALLDVLAGPALAAALRPAPRKPAHRRKVVKRAPAPTAGDAKAAPAQAASA